MADNVIKAVFANRRRVKTAPLWRYDHGIRLQPIGLELPENYEMHFSNSKTGEAKTMLADASGAVIPAEYLIPGTEVYAWIYLVGDSYGRTKAEIIIPVDAKAKPTDLDPTQEEQTLLDQMIAALQRDASSAAASAGIAADAAAEAQKQALSSESWAVGGTGSREGEDQNNSKFWAMVAQQGAEHSGYAIFDVNDQDGQMYVTITDPLAQDVSFLVNETTGELEVTING